MIKIIAAVNNKGYIGKDNKLLYKLPRDMERFKMLTTGSNIVMGLNTYKSIGKPLLDRLNIVMSYEPIPYKDGVIQQSYEEIIRNQVNTTIWVIGGAAIYKLFIDQAEILNITYVHDDTEGDTKFPDIDFNKFKIIYNSGIYYDNGYKCSNLIFERIV